MFPLNVFILISFVGIFVGLWSESVVGQNCGCAPDLCCSRFGYCGTDSAYCGIGCKQGPCWYTPPPNDASVADIVTPAFFNEIINQAGAGCAAKKFYSRNAFLEAVKSYPGFGSTLSQDESKREIAAFFAHVIGDFCYVPARNGIGFNGLQTPETVAKDPVIKFKAALWFWMNNVHSIITSGQGFGPTIRTINGGECNGGNRVTVEARVTNYRNYCHQLGVAPGDNLYC